MYNNKPNQIKKATAFFIVVLCMIITGASCAAESEHSINEPQHIDASNNTTTVSYIEYIKNFGIDLTDVTTLEDGEIKDDNEYAYICVTVVDGKLEDVKNQLNQVCGKMREVDLINIPAYQNHRLAEKMKKETIIGEWKKSITGKNGQKSRVITFYLTEQFGKDYLYIFG